MSARAFFLILAFPTVSLAQTSAVVDEGTLMITRQGAPLGRESFRIVRAPAPGGQVFRATGQSAQGSVRVTTSLGTDSMGVPVTYESELSRDGEVVQRLQGRGRPGRLSVIMSTKSGESAREYVLSNGALLMDEDVYHQFYFVPMAVGHDQVNVIAPRIGQQTGLRLDDRGQEALEVSGRSIQARHFALSGAGGIREVWVDDKGRLLKVAIPAKGLVAQRDDPPR
jgi:hypothetical protein